jgi:hypothetical protein
MWRFLSRLLGSTDAPAGFDPDTTALILRLHEEHPNLGHRGLHRVLEDQGVHVSQSDLKRFLRAEGIRIEGHDSTPPPSSTFPPVA